MRPRDSLIVTLLWLGIPAIGILLGLILPAINKVKLSAAMQRADASLANGDYDTAILHYEEIIGLGPETARPYHGRGLAYSHLGEYDKALSSLTQAIAFEPKNDVLFLDRGLAHWHKDAWNDAVKDYRRAIQINPRSDRACSSLAWALATAPPDHLRDGKKALELAQKACELTNWQDPFPISALAAAYAELGDFPKALEWHKKAMASPAFPADRMERARERLRLYEQGKPYREGFTKPEP